MTELPFSNERTIEYPITRLHRWGARKFRRLVAWCARHHIDPNWFTYLGLGCALGMCVSLWHGWWFAALLCIGLNGLSDVIDGELARATADKRAHWLNEYGVLLDPKVDRVNDIAAFIGLWLYAEAIGLPLWFQALIVVSGALHPVSSFIRAKYESLPIFQTRKIRFQEQKPLTRAAFMVFLAIVCCALWLAWGAPHLMIWAGIYRQSPYDIASVQYWIFVLGVLGLVCAPTLFNFFRRWHRSRTIFRSQGITPPG
ncbi:MAG: CDP-alcohol phosphatidyltransferase family protein [Patescibacteria group bacterium]